MIHVHIWDDDGDDRQFDGNVVAIGAISDGEYGLGCFGTDSWGNIASMLVALVHTVWDIAHDSGDLS